MCLLYAEYLLVEKLKWYSTFEREKAHDEVFF